MLKTLLSFPNVKISRTVFKTHVKWCALTFWRKYKKFSFLDKYNKFFVWKIVFSGKYNNFFFVWKTCIFGKVQESFSGKYKKLVIFPGKYQKYFPQVKIGSFRWVWIGSFRPMWNIFSFKKLGKKNIFWVEMYLFQWAKWVGQVNSLSNTYITFSKNKKVEPVQLILLNSNIYRKNLGWLHSTMIQSFKRSSKCKVDTLVPVYYWTYPSRI